MYKMLVYLLPSRVIFLLIYNLQRGNSVISIAQTFSYMFGLEAFMITIPFKPYPFQTLNERYREWMVRYTTYLYAIRAMVYVLQLRIGQF